MGPYLHGRLRGLEARLDAGEALPRALAHDADLYPAWLPGLLEAGQSAGRLERAVDEAGRLLAAEARVASLTRAGLAYPCVLAGLCALYVSFDVTVTWPALYRLARALESTAGSPWFAELVSSGTWFVIFGLLSVVILVPWVLLLVLAWPGRIARERRLRDLLRVLPGGGALLTDLDHAVVATVVGGAVTAGQPLHEALARAARLPCSRAGLGRELAAAALAIEQGTRPAEALASRDRRRGPFFFQLASALADRAPGERMLELAARLADGATADGAALAQRVSPVMVALVGCALFTIAAGQYGAMDMVMEAVTRELRVR